MSILGRYMSELARYCVMLLVSLVWGCHPDDSETLREIQNQGAQVTYADPWTIYISISQKQGDRDLETLAPLLKQLASIQGLHLQESAITDKGLAHLRDLRNVKSINLMDTSVTDNGLKSLHSVTSLEGLYLSGTKTTENGIKAIRRAMPAVRVQRIRRRNTRPQRRSGRWAAEWAANAGRAARYRSLCGYTLILIPLAARHQSAILISKPQDHTCKFSRRHCVAWN